MQDAKDVFKGNVKFDAGESYHGRGSRGPGNSENGASGHEGIFGATVRYANAAGAERVVSIVGTDDLEVSKSIPASAMI